jgi:hypothetical protein
MPVKVYSCSQRLLNYLNFNPGNYGARCAERCACQAKERYLLKLK